MEELVGKFQESQNFPMNSDIIAHVTFQADLEAEKPIKSYGSVLEIAIEHSKMHSEFTDRRRFARRVESIAHHRKRQLQERNDNKPPITYKLSPRQIF